MKSIRISLTTISAASLLVYTKSSDFHCVRNLHDSAPPWTYRGSQAVIEVGVWLTPAILINLARFAQCLDIAAEQKQRNLCSFRSLSLTYVPPDHWRQSTVGNASDHFKPIVVPRKLVDELKQQNLFESHSKRAQLKCYLAWLVCVCRSYDTTSLNTLRSY